MKKLLNYAITLILLTTTACGWHLRGGLDASELESIYVRSAMPHSGFAKLLKNDLASQGIRIPEQAEDAQYQVVVIRENSDSRTASITSSARAAEQTVVEEITVAVLDRNGDTLLDNTVLRAERSLDFDENQIIGKADELELVQQELLSDLVRQLTRRLQALSKNP
ncbi:LPS assembly lipoprotein LptE [Porticoccus sp. W117]|uniref:LPS-assembly lipoprotein LptE n=1 Tax=Porticoccus sp. W117 TaxID=3054777 RepID=UPI00259AC7EB|nr:LPS assembly lipoprotein LptE [Porticoccus sp. W117]MDM3870679.1 LPS assembly lipoprotein LptE [Porticoccus sp. W117]